MKTQANDTQFEKFSFRKKVDPKETELLHKDRLTDALSEKYSVKDFRYDDKTETITAKISAR